MIKRPAGMSAFEFSVVAALRAAQLARGCVPRVVRYGKVTVTAQHEVAEGKIVRSYAGGSGGEDGYGPRL